MAGPGLADASDKTTEIMPAALVRVCLRSIPGRNRKGPRAGALELAEKRRTGYLPPAALATSARSLSAPFALTAFLIRMSGGSAGLP